MKKYIFTLLLSSAISFPAMAQVNLGVNANTSADVGLNPSSVGIDSDIGVGANTSHRALNTRANGEVRADKREIRGDRRELRSDIRSKNKAEFRDDKAELKEDKQELREDRADRREDRKDRRADRRDDRKNINANATTRTRARIGQ